jgi:sulfatase maturation enzyme AslB (radical SAM superfamily)
MSNKTLYAVVTNHCNLSCRHCNIKDSADSYDEDKFLSRIKEYDGDITLFGGEPTLYKERLMKVLSTNKITSISTNLINLDDDLIKQYKDIYVATSWNHSRFIDAQYQIWLRNLKTLEAHGITCMVLITLTDDLINSNINDFINMVKLWAKEYKAIDSIMFEQLIDNDKTEDFYRLVDEWLCRIYKLWKENDIEIENSILYKLGNWKHDCTQISTLYPDGSTVQGCPHRSRIYVPSKCLTCSAVSKCRPCRLQQHCTYPKKLAQLVAETEKSE